MLNDFTGADKVYIACGNTDLRKGIDGLSMIIGDRYHQNPFEKGTLFLFCGRRSDRIKGLLWMGDGFLQLYKRLEAGSLSWGGGAGRLGRRGGSTGGSDRRSPRLLGQGSSQSSS